MMRKFVIGFLVAICCFSFAMAKTPPEVLAPYKAYMAALEKGDADTARKQAFIAWQKAESLMGNHKTTGALAVNYAMLKPDGDKASKKKINKAFERAIELSGLEEDPASAYLERSVEFMNFKIVNYSNNAAYSISKKITNYAEKYNLTQSTFYAEALTTQAGYYASKAKHKKAEAVAKKALEAFDTRTDDFVTVQPLLANMYNGYGLEGQQKSVEAALSYQKVMEALDGIQPDEHPLAAQALGRWSHMRAVLNSEGLLDEAEEKGLCQCWPYDKPRNEQVKAIKRVAPKMPRDAYVSGFTIIEFDLDDAGKPINEEILVSWPIDLYEKSSLKSLKQWQYTTRTAEETDEDRQGIISTLRYILTDSSGDIIF